MLTLSHCDPFTVMSESKHSRCKVECWETPVMKANGKKEVQDSLRNSHIWVKMYQPAMESAVLCKASRQRDSWSRMVLFLTFLFANWTAYNTNYIVKFKRWLPIHTYPWFSCFPILFSPIFPSVFEDFHFQCWSWFGPILPLQEISWEEWLVTQLSERLSEQLTPVLHNVLWNVETQVVIASTWISNVILRNWEWKEFIV